MANTEYAIVYKSSVDKDLRKLSAVVRRVVVTKIQALAINPYPLGVTKLRGTTDLFRVRHADYRIIYQVQNAQLIILIIKVGHRRDVYRGF